MYPIAYLALFLLLVLGTANSADNAEKRIVVTFVNEPNWSPRGASRFLELVREGYYDGVALNRVVPEFLTQFGISRNVELRRKYRRRSIFDDPPAMGQSWARFRPGYLSFAGSSGRNSRTSGDARGGLAPARALRDQLVGDGLCPPGGGREKQRGGG